MTQLRGAPRCLPRSGLPTLPPHCAASPGFGHQIRYGGADAKLGRAGQRNVTSITGHALPIAPHASNGGIPVLFQSCGLFNFHPGAVGGKPIICYLSYRSPTCPFQVGVVTSPSGWDAALSASAGGQTAMPACQRASSSFSPSQGPHQPTLPSRPSPTSCRHEPSRAPIGLACRVGNACEMPYLPMPSSL